VATPAFQKKPYADALLDVTHLWQPEDLEDIVAELKEAVDDLSISGPYALHCYTLLGVALTRLLRHDEAIRQFEATLHIGQSPATLSNLGAAYVQSRRYQDAIRVLTAVVEHSPFDPSGARAMLATAHAGVGNYERAAHLFREAVAMADPTSPQDALTLAINAALLGLDDLAVDSLARFLSLRDGLESPGPDPAEVLWQRRGTYEALFSSVPTLAGVVRGVVIQKELEHHPKGTTGDAAEPTDTLVQTVAAELAQLPAPLKLKRGPLPVVVETWSDGAVQACWPETALFGEGEDDATALDALREQIDEFAADMVPRVARGRVGGPLLEQWQAFCALVDVSGLAGAAQ
jgi:tetratricopeptide (TPR) repeat protein